MREKLIFFSLQENHRFATKQMVANSQLISSKTHLTTF